MDKLIRELREENDKLKKFLEGGGAPAVQDVGGGGAALSAEGVCGRKGGRAEGGGVLPMPQTRFDVRIKIFASKPSSGGAVKHFWNGITADVIL